MDVVAVPATPPSACEPQRGARPQVRGKFLFRGGEKFYIRGVTYGTFHPDAEGQEFHDPAQVERDFAAMAEQGINALRTYTVPPRWLLDCAARHDLLVMIGVPWEQHIAFLDDPWRRRAIVARVRQAVRSCAGHPAVLCFAVGNEIPTSVVRWYGARRIERFLKRLYLAAKAEDAGALVTYVNYPSTEYLALPFLDFACFNVYLEAETTLRAYLARLHNLVGEQPLVLAELGLDSRRNGEESQARVLEWQLQAAFGSGGAGAFVFAWTDEWYRGGYDIDDWDFGLTDRVRRPKPALAAVRRAFAEATRPGADAPRISVVVCSHNGARTLDETCQHLTRLDYPTYEVIVVDDGSTDQTAAIARGYGLRVISTPNRGLSSARNTGLAAASGEIVAYVDDDAYPDPQWLLYLSRAFARTQHVGIGGPNLPPEGDGLIAECVACAPGGPIHVLLSDEVAEHIPGCNMAFHKDALAAIGGFDPQFRVAGDDVDICWRLQQRGWTLGFAPGALVWHHRRNSVRTYWRQQKGYGKAEALLERKWPEKYNAAGHATWAGRLYGGGLFHALRRSRGKVFYGSWGLAPFQVLYPSTTGALASLLLMPECYLAVVALVVLGGLGFSWRPLLLAWPLLVLFVVMLLLQACLSASHAAFMTARRPWSHQLARFCLTVALYLSQPLARLAGRMRHGLTLWRSRVRAPGLVWPTRQACAIWSEQWHAPEEWLQVVETLLTAGGTTVGRGGTFDRWDVQARSGPLGGMRLRMMIEEHGGGKQLVRFAFRPRWSLFAILMPATFALLAVGAALDRAWVAAGVTAVLALLLGARMLYEYAASMGCLLGALERLRSADTAARRVRRVRAAPMVLHGPVPFPVPSTAPSLEEAMSQE